MALAKDERSSFSPANLRAQVLPFLPSSAVAVLAIDLVFVCHILVLFKG